MSQASASQHYLVAGTFPSSHARLARAANSGPLSGVLFHRRVGWHRLSRALLAVSNPSANGEFICTKNQPLDGKLRVEKYFQVEMMVQDCELDNYGVVNNVIYASYIEKAREEMLVSLGIGTQWIISTGKAMALSELNLKYFTPLRRGDRFVVKVRVVRITGVRAFVKHLIETLPDHKLVLEATATVVCLDTHYRPSRVLPEMSAKLHDFFSSMDGK